MPDLTVEDLRTQGGLKPATTGRGMHLLPTDGLIIVDPHASWITSGRKKVIIKSRPFNISGIEFLLLTRNNALGIIKLSAPKLIGVKEFKDLEPLHLIDETTRKKFWPKYREFWAYKILTLKVFAHPVPIKPLVGPQVVAHNVELELKGSPTMFELEKAEADALDEFAYRLKIIAHHAPMWAKTTLRFATGPKQALIFVRSFPQKMEQAAKTFPSERALDPTKQPLPEAVEEAIEWGGKARRALLDEDNKKLVADVVQRVVGTLRTARRVIDALERAEDEPMLKLEIKTDESNDFEDV